MNNDERAFLAQVALGWFQVKPDGAIWRTVEFVGGGAPTMRRVLPRRAETSSAGKSKYLRVAFWDGGVRRKVGAHRIVWMVANGETIPAPMEINHINGDKRDNRPENLERVTHQGNTLHAFTLPRKKKAQRGEMNASAKVNSTQVAEIRALWDAKAMSQRKIGELYGLTQSAVWAIVHRKSWIF